MRLGGLMILLHLSTPQLSDQTAIHQTSYSSSCVILLVCQCTDSCLFINFSRNRSKLEICSWIICANSLTCSSKRSTLAALIPAWEIFVVALATFLGVGVFSPELGDLGDNRFDVVAAILEPVQRGRHLGVGVMDLVGDVLVGEPLVGLLI